MKAAFAEIHTDRGDTIAMPNGFYHGVLLLRLRFYSMAVAPSERGRPIPLSGPTARSTSVMRPWVRATPHGARMARPASFWVHIDEPCGGGLNALHPHADGRE